VSVVVVVFVEQHARLNSSFIFVVHCRSHSFTLRKSRGGSVVVVVVKKIRHPSSSIADTDADAAGFDGTDGFLDGNPVVGVALVVATFSCEFDYFPQLRYGTCTVRQLRQYCCSSIVY